MMDAVRILSRKLATCMLPSPAKRPPRIYVEGYDQPGHVHDPRVRSIDLAVAPVPEGYKLRNQEEEQLGQVPPAAASPPAAEQPGQVEGAATGEQLGQVSPAAASPPAAEQPGQVEGAATGEQLGQVSPAAALPPAAAEDPVTAEDVPAATQDDIRYSRVYVSKSIPYKYKVFAYTASKPSTLTRLRQARMSPVSSFR